MSGASEPTEKKKPQAVLKLHSSSKQPTSDSTNNESREQYLARREKEEHAYAEQKKLLDDLEDGKALLHQPSKHATDEEDLLFSAVDDIIDQLEEQKKNKGRRVEKEEKESISLFDDESVVALTDNLQRKEEEDSDDDISVDELCRMAAQIAKEPTERSGGTTSHEHIVKDLLETTTTTSMNGNGRELVLFADDETAKTFAATAKAKFAPPPKQDVEKIKKMPYVDHSVVTYQPVTKDFYIPPDEISSLSDAEVRQLKKDLDGAKTKGSLIPRPMKSWMGVGLPEEAMELLQELGFHQPYAVQCVAIPVLMSGRDLLSIAKTGSGKTLAYVLPMIRHVMNQPRPGSGAGPIALILVPTQELAAQVFNVAAAFCKKSKLRIAASYGGSSLQDNMTVCKKGCDVMVATPGRLLDLYVDKSRMLSLERTSFVVLDEADRMFDMGFEQHVTAFLKNIRPDRQTAMLSATMPPQVKKAAKLYLSNPVEISVGGRPCPASNVSQEFYFFDELVYEPDPDKRQEDPRFLKLLDVLGEELATKKEKGLPPCVVLIFVQGKEDCDELYARLKIAGYGKRIATLYSGMDHMDREESLLRFKKTDRFILIATGLAERGLDVMDLDLVVNYCLPDHYEAFVHRIGRTGRAGRPGRAVNFYTRTRDDPISIELVEGLEQAGQLVPDELVERATQQRGKLKRGEALHSESFKNGYGRGKSFKFSSREEKKNFKEKAKAAGLDEFISSESSDEFGSDEDTDGAHREQRPPPDIVSVPVDATTVPPPSSTSLVRYQGSAGALVLSSTQQDRVATALAHAARATQMHAEGSSSTLLHATKFVTNDYPQHVRSKIMSREFLKALADETSTSIVVRGEYFDPRSRRTHKRADEQTEDLHLYITGKERSAVERVVEALENKIKEAEEKVVKRHSSFSVNF